MITIKFIQLCLLLLACLACSCNHMQYNQKRDAVYITNNNINNNRLAGTEWKIIINEFYSKDDVCTPSCMAKIQFEDSAIFNLKIDSFDLTGIYLLSPTDANSLEKFIVYPHPLKKPSFKYEVEKLSYYKNYKSIANNEQNILLINNMHCGVFKKLSSSIFYPSSIILHEDTLSCSNAIGEYKFIRLR